MPVNDPGGLRDVDPCVRMVAVDVVQAVGLTCVLLAWRSTSVEALQSTVRLACDRWDIGSVDTPCSCCRC